MHRTPAALLGATTVVALLTSCGAEDRAEPTAAPVAQETATPAQPEPATAGPTAAPVATPATEPPGFPADASPQFVEASWEAELVLTDVRVAEHDGFDRIVVEFSGEGVPGWSVAYTETPQLEGSGDAVPLDGDTALGIFASDTTWPAPDYDDSPRRLSPPGASGVVDLYVAGTFEGYTQVLAGVAGRRSPYRVFALTEPSRLVVDVLDERAG